MKKMILSTVLVILTQMATNAGIVTGPPLPGSSAAYLTTNQVFGQTPQFILYSNNTVFIRGQGLTNFPSSTTAGIMECYYYLTNANRGFYQFGSNAVTFSAMVAENQILRYSSPIICSNMNYNWVGAGNHSSVFMWTGTTNWTTLVGCETNVFGNSTIVLAGRFNEGYEDFQNIGACTIRDIGFTTASNFPVWLLTVGSERNFVENCLFSDAFALSHAINSESYPLSVNGLAFCGSSGNVITGNKFYSLATGSYCPPSQAAGSPLLRGDTLLTFMDNEGYTVGSDDSGGGNVYPTTNALSAGALLLSKENNSARIIHNHVTVGNTVVFLCKNSNGPYGNFYCSDNIIESGMNPNFNAYVVLTNAGITIDEWPQANNSVVVSGPNDYTSTDGNAATGDTNALQITRTFSAFQSSFQMDIYRGGNRLFSLNEKNGLSVNGSGITNATASYATNDLVNGATNVNNTTHTVFRTIPVKVSAPATTLGSAEIDAQLFIGGAWITVDDLNIAGGATSVIATNKTTLKVTIPSGVPLRLTNTVSGSGYVAGFDASATNTYTLLP